MIAWLYEIDTGVCFSCGALRHLSQSESLLPCYKGAYIVILCCNNMLQIPFYTLH